MIQTITDATIDRAFHMSYDDQSIREKAKDLISIQEALKHVAGEYFWLPVFEMLNEAELINKDLTPGDFLVNYSMVIQGYNQVDDGDPEAVYFLTRDGLDFLGYIMFCVTEDEETLNGYLVYIH
jgi:hypothetical protein